MAVDQDSAAKPRRPLALVTLVALTAVAVALTVAAVAAYRIGPVDIRVREVTPGGSDVAIRLPGALVAAVIHATPSSFFPSVPAEVVQALPIIEAAQRSLARQPDFVLVRVVSGDQRVRVAKRGGNLVVDVDGDACTVQAALPLTTLATAARKLARRSSAAL